MQPILPHLRKELLIPLLSPQQTDQQDASTVDREQRADGVEFCGEDLEDDPVCSSVSARCGLFERCGRFWEGFWAYREKEN